MQKKINLVIAFIMSCSIYGFTQNFGPPTWMDIATWAFTYTGCSCEPALNQSYSHRNSFVTTLQSKCSAYNPSISSLHRINLDDNNGGTLESFQSTAKDMCEVVFYVGHGKTDTHNLVFLNNQTCQRSRYFNFGGNYTKWVFLEACTALYDQTANNYNSWFNGAHAIFGYRSMYYQWPTISNWWDCIWFGCDYSSSWDRWTYLWNNWFSGQQMWTAYTNALTQNINEANSIYSGYISGGDFAVVQVCGWALGNDGYYSVFYGAKETVSNTFHNETPTQNSTGWLFSSLIHWNTVIGSPTYQ
jgi:hypothetical protein